MLVAVCVFSVRIDQLLCVVVCGCVLVCSCLFVCRSCGAVRCSIWFGLIIVFVCVCVSVTFVKCLVLSCFSECPGLSMSSLA